MSINAVLFHHPDGVDTSRAHLMGRHAAGEGFLQGFVRHADVDAFYAQTMTEEHFKDFATRVGAWDAKARPCHRIPVGGALDRPDALTLMIPGPTLSSFAWRRRMIGARAYSLCGVNHTIASDTIMDGLGELLTTPVQEWDAVICTSQAVKATVLRLLDHWADFLNERTGGNVRTAVQLPVIPLGVDCQAYGSAAAGSRERVRLRRGLGIGDNDVAVLFVGRLSFHAKAHPLPMYLALEEAVRQTKKRVHLIQAGWFATKAIEKEFRDGARTFCPSVHPIFLDGRESDVRFRIWSAADVFTSLSDNIQETFGLTPIEAMAAGLPVVATDWNGYRDTVRDGIDGFAVPTWMAPGGTGGDLAIPFELDMLDRDQNYNRYCGVVSQCTAVDVRRCVEAFVALIGNAELRSEMGAKARVRALERFDWRVVVGAYQELWRELGRIRERGREIAPKRTDGAVHPLRDDPFALFAAYPTATIGPESSVSAVAGADAGRVRALKRFPMNEFASKTFLDDADIEGILARLHDIGTLSVAALKESVDPERRNLVERTVAWLAKMNVVRLAEPSDARKRSRSSGKQRRRRRRHRAPRQLRKRRQILLRPRPSRGTPPWSEKTIPRATIDRLGLATMPSQELPLSRTLSRTPSVIAGG
ncbi:MAG: glycosyltransferase [Rhodospirillales bacterium]|nr:glycosyltransferase [Rhodospirillales bacterium]